MSENEPLSLLFLTNLKSRPCCCYESPSHVPPPLLAQRHVHKYLHIARPEKCTHAHTFSCKHSRTRPSAAARVLSLIQTQTFIHVGQESATHSPVTPRRSSEYSVYTAPIRDHRQTYQQVYWLEFISMATNMEGEAIHPCYLLSNFLPSPQHSPTGFQAPAPRRKCPYSLEFQKQDSRVGGRESLQV